MKVIFNPTAGRRRTALLWRVLDILVANGVRVDLMKTGGPGHAELLARDAAAAGAGMVVAAGGDGTVAEVANGLMGTTTHLGIIPLGTANVLAHELALPFAPRAIASALTFQRTRTLWPGLAVHDTEARLFVQMVGVGFDAQVVHALPLCLKRWFGRGAYVIETLAQLPRYEYASIPVRLDGMDTQAHSVIVSKGTFYGGRYPVALNADPGATGFSVVLFDRGGPLRTLIYGAALPLHQLGHAPGVRHVRASRVEFPGNWPAPVQADGDRAGFLPLLIRDAPHPIEIVAG